MTITICAPSLRLGPPISSPTEHCKCFRIQAWPPWNNYFQVIATVFRAWFLRFLSFCCCLLLFSVDSHSLATAPTPSTGTFTEESFPLISKATNQPELGCQSTPQQQQQPTCCGVFPFSTSPPDGKCKQSYRNRVTFPSPPTFWGSSKLGSPFALIRNHSFEMHNCLGFKLITVWPFFWSLLRG